MLGKEKNAILDFTEDEMTAFFTAIMYELLVVFGWLTRSADNTGYDITDKGMARLEAVIPTLSEEARFRVFLNMHEVEDEEKQDEFLLMSLIHEKFIKLGWEEPSQDTFKAIFTDKGIDRLSRVAQRLSQEHIHHIFEATKRLCSHN